MYGRAQRNRLGADRRGGVHLAEAAGLELGAYGWQLDGALVGLGAMRRVAV